MVLVGRMVVDSVVVVDDGGNGTVDGLALVVVED